MDTGYHTDTKMRGFILTREIKKSYIEKMA